MLIHFPSALLPMDFLFGVMGQYLELKPLLAASYYCLMAGVLGGWVAMAAGLFDLVLFIKPGSPAVSKVVLHLCIQVAVIICFSVLLALEYKNTALQENPAVSMIIGKAVLLGTMFFGNYLGGEIVLKYIAKEFQ